MQQQISNRQRESLDISLTDLEEVRFRTLRCELQFSVELNTPHAFPQFCAEQERFRDFVSDIQSNARRYTSLFAEAADELMPESSVNITDEDSFDVLMRQARNKYVCSMGSSC